MRNGENKNKETSNYIFVVVVASIYKEDYTETVILISSS